MNRTHLRLAVAVAIYCATGRLFAAEPSPLPPAPDGSRLSGRLLYFMPEKEGYDTGLGLEGNYEIWMSENWGLSLGAGYWKWDTITKSWAFGDPASGENYDGSWLSGVASTASGEIRFLSLGASALYRHEFGKDWRMVAEAGVKYLMADSDVEISGYYAWAQGTGFNTRAGNNLFRQTLEWDNSLQGVVSARIERSLCPPQGALGHDPIIFAGLGYNFDIVQSQLTLDGRDAGEATLNAFCLFAGVAFPL